MFTGNIEFYNSKNKLVRILEYDEGYLINEKYFKYRKDKQYLCFEFIYYREKINPKTKSFLVHIRKSYYNNGELKNFKEYSKNSKLLKQQSFKINGELKYYCEYIEGVKNGKEILIQNNKQCINIFENGKKIK